MLGKVGDKWVKDGFGVNLHKPSESRQEVTHEQTLMKRCALKHLSCSGIYLSVVCCGFNNKISLHERLRVLSWKEKLDRIYESTFNTSSSLSVKLKISCFISKLWCIKSQQGVEDSKDCDLLQEIPHPFPQELFASLSLPLSVSLCVFICLTHFIHILYCLFIHGSIAHAHCILMG